MTGDLLAKARAAGKLAGRGQFQVDAERATDKLERFQLVDPHHYVLELVKAAHLLGAKVIEFVIDTDEMEVCFDGQSLGIEDLSELQSALFSERSDARQRAVRHIAIAVNAAKALGPREIVIESVGPEGGAGLLLRAGEQAVLARLAPERALNTRKVRNEDGLQGTRIYLRERIQPRHFIQFFDMLNGRLDEAWRTLHDEVLREATWRLFTRFITSLTPGERAVQQDWLRPTLLRAHRQFEAAPLSAEIERAFFSAAEGLALYATVGDSLNGSSVPISIAHALRRVGHRRLYICREHGDDARAMVNAPIIYAEPDESEAFFLRFVDEIVDLTDRLHAVRETQKNRDRWEGLVWSEGLSKIHYPHQMVLEHARMRAVVGMDTFDMSGMVAFVRDGRLLVQRPLGVRCMRLSMVLCGDFQPNERFDGPRSTAELDALGLAILEALPEFMHHPKARMPATQTVDYLHELLDGRLLGRIAAAIDLSEAALQSWSDTCAAGDRLSVWQVHALDWSELASATLTDQILEALGAIADTPLFDDVAGELLSLRQINAFIRGEAAGACWLLPREDQALWIPHVNRNPDNLYLQFHVATNAIFRAVFGPHIMGTLERESWGELTVDPAPGRPAPSADSPKAQASSDAEHQLGRLVSELMSATLANESHHVLGAPSIAFYGGPAPRIASLNEWSMVLFRAHPVVAYALQRPDDPIAVSLVLQAVFLELRRLHRGAISDWRLAHRRNLERVLAPIESR
ncbi:MAG: hypothetical protein H0U74_20675 [Bradymonadaceae bacterium]|nr:hypothetical protein [Lujinxingiaceae bacterium]